MITTCWLYPVWELGSDRDFVLLTNMDGVKRTVASVLALTLGVISIGTFQYDGGHILQYLKRTLFKTGTVYSTTYLLKFHMDLLDEYPIRQITRRNSWDVSR